MVQYLQEEAKAVSATQANNNNDNNNNDHNNINYNNNNHDEKNIMLIMSQPVVGRLSRTQYCLRLTFKVPFSARKTSCATAAALWAAWQRGRLCACDGRQLQQSPPPTARHLPGAGGTARTGRGRVSVAK